MWRLRRIWDVLLALAGGVLAGAVIAPAVWDKVSAEIVTFVGIQAAAVFPAMIFTAGVLRPDGLSLREADRYQAALRGQMRFWIVMFALDFTTALVVIMGKASGWSLTLPIPWLGDLNAASMWSFLVVSCGILAILRTVPFIRGVLSLLDLTGQLTKKAISQRVADERRRDPVDLGRVERPNDYGDVLKH